jgi:hypothetical protein
MMGDGEGMGTYDDDDDGSDEEPDEFFGMGSDEVRRSLPPRMCSLWRSDNRLT